MKKPYEAAKSHAVRHLSRETPLEGSGMGYLPDMPIQDAIYASYAAGRRIETAGFGPA